MVSREKNNQKTIPEIVREEILKIDGAAEVILFGSQARGDSNLESDWDFLVLINQKVTSKIKTVIRRKLYKIELDTDQIISSIIYQKKDWEEMEITPLYRNIKEEGIEV